MRGDGLGLLRDLSGERRLRGGGGERRPAGEHLVAKYPERVEIGPVIYVRIGGSLLRGHVRGGAKRDTDRRQRATARGAHCLRHAEVGDHRVLPRDQHIVRLDVAMHDPVSMGVSEGVGDVGEDADRLAHRELALAAELSAQRLALDERHRVVEQVPGGRGRQQGNDVRVLEGGGEFDLAPETLDVDAGGHLGRQHLDDDLALERGLVREEHAAHPPATELPLDAIGVAQRNLKASLEVAHKAAKIGFRTRLGEQRPRRRSREGNQTGRV